MHLVLNFRSGLAPLNLDLPGEEEEILALVREAIASESLLELTDARGDRYVIPGQSIGYAAIPTHAAHPVGFGRL